MINKLKSPRFTDPEFPILIQSRKIIQFFVAANIKIIGNAKRFQNPPPPPSIKNRIEYFVIFLRPLPPKEYFWKNIIFSKMAILYRNFSVAGSVMFRHKPCKSYPFWIQFWGIRKNNIRVNSGEHIIFGTNFSNRKKPTIFTSTNFQNEGLPNLPHPLGNPFCPLMLIIMAKYHI